MPDYVDSMDLEDAEWLASVLTDTWALPPLHVAGLGGGFHGVEVPLAPSEYALVTAYEAEDEEGEVSFTVRPSAHQSPTVLVAVTLYDEHGEVVQRVRETSTEALAGTILAMIPRL